MNDNNRPELAAWRERLARTLDERREEARAKRHSKGYRTARENLEDLVDPGSFLEYGQLAVAAQRRSRAATRGQRDRNVSGGDTGASIASIFATRKDAR